MDNQASYIQARFWILFAKKINQEVTENELIELESLMAKDPELLHQAAVITDMWQQQHAESAPNADEAFVRHLVNYKDEFFSEELHHNTEIYPDGTFESKPAGRLHGFKKILAFSSVLILSLAAYFYFFNESAKSGDLASNSVSSSVVTKNGNRTKITLPDGSQVWLNAGSKLDYNDLSFTQQGQREVFLSGEAFFDVVKNPKRPFIVHTDNIQVKVLGTAFNVKSYPGEKQTETSLIRGMVEVTIPSRPQEKYVLHPSEKLVLSNSGAAAEKPKELARVEMKEKEPEAIVSIRKVNFIPERNLIVETAWVENRLEFKSEKFIDIAARMERWYDVKISFSNKKIENKILTGSFENETIVQALEALKIVEPFNYSIEGKNVIIKP